MNGRKSGQIPIGPWENPRRDNRSKSSMRVGSSTDNNIQNSDILMVGSPTNSRGHNSSYKNFNPMFS